MSRRSIFSLLISFVLIIVFLSTSVVIDAKDDTVKINKEMGATIDTSALRDKGILKTNRDNYRSVEKNIILDIKWGVAVDQLKMEIFQESIDSPVSYVTPSSYTVDKNGNIYVADTLNSKIKVFINNNLIRSIDLPHGREKQITVKPGEVVNSTIPFVLRDIAVDDEGNIFGLNYLANEAVKINKTDKVETVFDMPGQEKINRPETIDILSSGKIMIQDNLDAENATRVRKFNANGGVISEKKKPNIIDFDLYEYESQSGDTIGISTVGYRTHQIEVKSKTNGLRKGIANISSEPVSNDMRTNTMLLGSDKQGYSYFWMQDTPLLEKKGEMSDELFRQNSKEYINRVDAINNRIDTIKIENTDMSMANSTANLSNRFIKMDNDGNIYQLIMNAQGYKIIKYSFM